MLPTAEEIIAIFEAHPEYAWDGSFEAWSVYKGGGKICYCAGGMLAKHIDPDFVEADAAHDTINKPGDHEVVAIIARAYPGVTRPWLSGLVSGNDGIGPFPFQDNPDYLAGHAVGTAVRDYFLTLYGVD